MEEYTSYDYLNKKREELSGLEKEIKYLEEINIPLKILKCNDKMKFYSEDYSLATTVKIKKRSDMIDNGLSTPDGGYYTIRYELYAQFYFTLKTENHTIKVRLIHEKFDEDENVVLKSIDVCYGTKDFSDRSGQQTNYTDQKKVLEYFAQRGVKKEVVEKLEKKLKKLNDWVI